jgi:mono/diheme cytochrome c family protein
MRQFLFRLSQTALLFSFALPVVTEAQSDAVKTYKANCIMCHSADGSGSTGMGKTLQATDLRSEEVQKQTDDALSGVITKGRDKMPAFGGKIPANEVATLIAYIRTLPKRN